jgi:hypothetical protein
MITRTIRTIVEFKRPFFLATAGRTQPAGRYRVETDEASIDGFSLLAYRRTATRIYLAVDGAHPGVSEEILVEPHELAAALLHDARHVIGDASQNDSSK